MLDAAWFSIAITNTCWIAEVAAAAGACAVGSAVGSAGSGLSSAQPANARLLVMTQASLFMVPPRPIYHGARVACVAQRCQTEGVKLRRQLRGRRHEIRAPRSLTRADR